MLFLAAHEDQHDQAGLPSLWERLGRRCRNARRRGATAMEYLFVISLILVVAITTIGSLGQQTKKLNERNSSAIDNATSGNLSSGS